MCINCVDGICTNRCAAPFIVSFSNVVPTTNTTDCLCDLANLELSILLHQAKCKINPDAYFEPRFELSGIVLRHKSVFYVNNGVIPEPVERMISRLERVYPDARGVILYQQGIPF